MIAFLIAQFWNKKFEKCFHLIWEKIRIWTLFTQWLLFLLNNDMHWIWITLSRHSSFVLKFLDNFLVFVFFPWNCIKVKKVKQILCICWKYMLKDAQIYVENFPWRKLKKPNLPVYWKKHGSFVGKYFCHLCHSEVKRFYIELTQPLAFLPLLELSFKA